MRLVARGAGRGAWLAVLSVVAGCATAPSPNTAPAEVPRSSMVAPVRSVDPARPALETPAVAGVTATTVAGAQNVAAPVAEPTLAVTDAVPQGAHAGSVPLERGLASWYGRRFQGRRTASGERYHPGDFTAAHKTLPFGTKVRVRSVATGKVVVVRINDRGPYLKKRVIDLSEAAITALGLRHRGVTAVELLPE